MTEHPPRYSTTGKTTISFIPYLPNPDAPTHQDLESPDAVTLATGDLTFYDAARLDAALRDTLKRRYFVVRLDTRPFIRMLERAQRGLAAAARVLFPEPADFFRRLHQAEHGDRYAQHRRRCRICNPAGNPRPLPINGHEYTRRRRARARHR